MQLPGLRLGRFRLIKRIPAAAGLGGGSADAAAALRLLATEVGLPLDDPRVLASARATGADVPACLSPQARTMRGIGDELGPAIRLPNTFAVLVNPQVQAPTPKVFAAFDLASESQAETRARQVPAEGFAQTPFWIFAPWAITTSKLQQSAWRRRSKLCLRDCPKFLRPKRSACQVQVRLVLLCLVIGAARLPRSGLLRRTIQNGGSRRLSS